MVPERLRRALEPFEPVYTPQKDGSTHVHIPGAENEWMFHERTPGNTLVEARFVGSGDPWMRAADVTGATRQVADNTLNSSYYLKRLVHGLTYGERNHTRIIQPRELTDKEKQEAEEKGRERKAPEHTYRLRVGQESVEVRDGQFEKHIHTHLTVDPHFDRFKRYHHHLSTHPDHTALTADPMPDRIREGTESVLQGHMPPEVLIDELLDHHEAHPQQFARQFARAVRMCDGS